MIFHSSLGTAIIHALLMIEGLGVAPTLEMHGVKCVVIKICNHHVNRLGLYSYQNRRPIFDLRSGLWDDKRQIKKFMTEMTGC